MNGVSSKSRILAIMVVAVMLCVPFIGSISLSDDADAAEPSYKVFYDSLNADEKMVYDAFVDYADNEELGNIEITIDHMVASESMSKALYAFKWEHPEYFWIEVIDNYTFDGSKLTIPVELIEPVAEATDKADAIDDLQSAVDTEVDKYITEGKLRYDLIKGFHDRIIDNCRYDKPATLLPQGTYDNAYNILGVFCDEEAVCQGYAMAMKYLCDIAGIPCINISGDAYTEPGSAPEGHMWNYIQMDDGKWYCLDVTWDDPTTSDGRDILRFDYFLVGSNTVIDGMKFIESHVPDYDGGLSDFGSVIPSVTSIAPMTLSTTDYPIRPGSESDVNYLIGDGGDDIFVLKKELIDPNDDKNILDKVGSKGKATIIANGVKFTMSYNALKQILAEMENNHTDKFIFGCEVKEITLKDVFSRDYTRVAYAPFILDGTDPVLDLEHVGRGMDVTISIPYEKTDDDFDFLLKTWSVDSDGELDDVDCVYKDGYMTFTTDEMDEVYVITSNPLGDFSIVWVGVVGIAAILVLLIIVVLIVRFIVRR
ncbi:MAG: hypothetical protein J6V08_00260 [Candidatus Methanomethylophilaceae archaeon]|nr:hypothetical protein [Candidatus Methanomethylophilaceae archaeon]